MKHLRNFIKIIPAVLATSLSLAASVSAWGPERATFTMEAPATYPTFNSITNNPTIGDERDFVRVGEINAAVTDLKNEVEVIPGKQYLVYVYFHNNASSTYNSSAYNNSGVALKTRMATTFPTILTPKEKGTISATITAENSNPLSVWDEAYFTTKTQKVLLSYVEGSAKIYNDWKANGTVMPSNLFTTNGTLVGLNDLNGVIPGCEEYHGVVTYVVEAKELSGSIEKTASKTEMAPGDEVEFVLTIKNTGDVALTNAVVKDALPEGLTLVSGSVRLSANSSTTEDSLSDNLILTGYNLGRVGTGNTVYIKYRAKAGDNFDCNGKKVTNTASLTYDSEVSSGDSKTASAMVTVKKVDGCNTKPEEEPKDDPDDPKEEPEEPKEEPEDPKKDPEEEPLPEKIVETGPLEIAMAVVVVLAIIGAVIYFWHSRRTLKNVEKKVSGKAEKEDHKEENQEKDENKEQKEQDKE